MTLPKPKLTAHQDFMTGNVYLKAKFPYQEVREELGVLGVYHDVLTATPREHLRTLWSDAVAAVMDNYLRVVYGNLPTIIRYLDTLGVPEHLSAYKDDIRDLREQFDTIAELYIEMPYHEATTDSAD